MALMRVRWAAVNVAFSAPEMAESHFALDGEDVGGGELPVVTLRPEMGSTISVAMRLL